MPPRKGFFIRAAAALIDAIILFAALFAIYYVLPRLSDVDITSETVFDFIFAITLLVYSTLDMVAAGTPGKRLLGLTIANANGTRAPFSVLSLRWSTKYFWTICLLLHVLSDQSLFRLVSGLSGVAVMIGCLFASNDDHQAWHDRWCRTAVFRRGDVSSTPALPATPASPPPL
jgi:uncharacterized RDD family membrane protein YckC